MQYKLSTISSVINGDLIGDSDLIVKFFSIDSRKVSNAEFTLFFALEGEKRDGHLYIGEAYLKGVKCFVVNKNKLKEFQLKYSDANFCAVDNTLRALQDLAAYHRSTFNFPVIGITGSNGKTIVKEWLYILLKDDFNIVRSPKSYNSQIGVPLSILLADQSNNLGIFEAGISMPNEMENLWKIIRPDIGVFTNIGSAHNENFIDNKQKADEKIKLFKNHSFLIYHKDYQEIDLLVNQYKINSFTWSNKKKSDFQISQIKKGESQTHIQAIYNNDFIDIDIPFIDDASIENAINCWLVLIHLNIKQEVIKYRMMQLLPIAMRLEVKEGINNCILINDYYNSDFVSIQIALDFLKLQLKNSTNTLILSDVQQTGMNPSEYYKLVNELIIGKGITKLIGIGDDLYNNQNIFSLPSKFYKTTNDFISSGDYNSFIQENILIKGSRVFEFEKISRVLQKKIHKTVMEINLNALENNLNHYKNLIKPTTKVMVMVKALAYGSGLNEISNFLQFHKVDYLGVAFVDEGIQLREAGVNLPIIVMNPEPQGYQQMIHHKLEPEIFSFRIYREFISELNSSNVNDPYPIHIKIDTGMHRLGFEIEELDELLDEIKLNSKMKVQSVFSHLATSDEPENDIFTKKQISIFNDASALVESKIGYKVIKHILNSAGIAAYGFAQFDMVRLGIGLYGVSPFKEHQDALEVVSELKTTISQIKQLNAGDAVGYGRKEVVTKPMKSATVPIGYADGLPRLIGNRKGYLIVNGYKAPIIGNVCMDMTMIDVTDIDAKEGDDVEVFGKSLPVGLIAQWAQTIPYEIFTSISPRVKRVYFQD